MRLPTNEDFEDLQVATSEALELRAEQLAHERVFQALDAALEVAQEEFKAQLERRTSETNMMSGPEDEVNEEV